MASKRIMIKSLRHIGMVVKDMDESLRFWKSLGFSPIYHRIEKWGGRKIEVAKLSLENSDIIELIKGNWRNHIALTVEDISKVPGEKKSKVIHRSTGHKIVLALSPEGVMIEFVEEPK